MSPVIDSDVAAPAAPRRTASGPAARVAPSTRAAPGSAPAAMRAANARARAVTDRPVPGSVRREPVLPVRAPRLAPATRWTIGAAGVALLGIATVTALNLVTDPVRFPVSNVDVTGTLDYVDRGALQDLVAGYTDQGFYGLDIDGLRSAVEALPWVAEARVGREWPGRLTVGIEEHEPAARWNDDALVSKRLTLFRPPQLDPASVDHADWRRVFASLPALVGGDGRHPSVLEDFRRYERELRALGLTVERVEEDARGSQTLVLGGGVSVRLGQSARETRFRRFLDVWPRLAPAVGTDPASFDMRYADGFALGGTRAAFARGSSPKEGAGGDGREG